MIRSAACEVRVDEKNPLIAQLNEVAFAITWIVWAWHQTKMFLKAVFVGGSGPRRQRKQRDEKNKDASSHNHAHDQTNFSSSNSKQSRFIHLQLPGLTIFAFISDAIFHVSAVGNVLRFRIPTDGFPGQQGNVTQMTEHG